MTVQKLDSEPTNPYCSSMMKTLDLHLTPEQFSILSTFCTCEAEIDLDPQPNEDGTFSVNLTDPADETGEVVETATFQTEAEAEAFIDLCLAELPANSGRKFDGQPRPYLLKAGFGWDCPERDLLPDTQFDSAGEAEAEALDWTTILADRCHDDCEKVDGLLAAWIPNPDQADVKGPRDAEWDRQLFEAAAAWSRAQNRYPEDEEPAGAWLPLADLREAYESLFTLVRVTWSTPFHPDLLADLTYITPGAAAELLSRRAEPAEPPQGADQFAVDGNGNLYCYRVEVEGKGFAVAVGERFNANGSRLTFEAPLFDHTALDCAIEAVATIRQAADGFHLVDEGGTAELLTGGAGFPTVKAAVEEAAWLGFTFAQTPDGLMDLETFEVLDPRRGAPWGIIPLVVNEAKIQTARFSQARTV